ncbi:MAG TPA: hypothetical protein ACQGQH_03280 [Xylella sp.]
MRGDHLACVPQYGSRARLAVFFNMVDQSVSTASFHCFVDIGGGAWIWNRLV